MNSNDQTPFKRLAFTLQYLWRLAIPFWMFRDAGHGTVEQRIANYRYNRAQRKILPFFMGKWVGIAICMMQLTGVLSDLMATASTQSTNYMCAAFFCMSAGIGFAFACIVLTVLLTSYLYLTYVER
jgi:hypothetical protein